MSENCKWCGKDLSESSVYEDYFCSNKCTSEYKHEYGSLPMSKFKKAYHKLFFYGFIVLLLIGWVKSCFDDNSESDNDLDSLQQTEEPKDEEYVPHDLYDTEEPDSDTSKSEITIDYEELYDEDTILFHQNNFTDNQESDSYNPTRLELLNAELKELESNGASKRAIRRKKKEIEKLKRRNK